MRVTTNRPEISIFATKSNADNMERSDNYFNEIKDGTADFENLYHRDTLVTILKSSNCPKERLVAEWRLSALEAFAEAEKHSLRIGQPYDASDDVGPLGDMMRYIVSAQTLIWCAEELERT